MTKAEIEYDIKQNFNFKDLILSYGVRTIRLPERVRGYFGRYHSGENAIKWNNSLQMWQVGFFIRQVIPRWQAHGRLLYNVDSWSYFDMYSLSPSLR